MSAPEFDITALMMGDAKAERDSQRALAWLRGDADLAESDGFLKSAVSAEEQRERDRTIGSAIGSGVSNFATGYALSPLLVKAYGGDPDRALVWRKLKENPSKHLKGVYGKKALVAGGVLSGAALVGGAIRENVQSAYERGARKQRREARREDEKVAEACPVGPLQAWRDQVRHDWENGGKQRFVEAGRRNYEYLMSRIKSASGSMATTSGPAGALNRVTGSITKPKGEYERMLERLKKRTNPDGLVERRSSKSASLLQVDDDLCARLGEKAAALGIMAYTRDPGEVPKSKRPEKAKGRAATMFRGLDARHALHKRTERKGEEWHAANSEFVEIGDRPGLSEALGEILGLEPGQVLSRREVSKMIGEDVVRGRSYEYRRAAKKQDRNATHVPGDTREVIRTMKTLLENPEARFFEVVDA